ncbi:MAG: hypothetical protein Tsb0014_01010 [Pleurocapsa sp.]
MRLQFRGKTYEAPHIEWDVVEGDAEGVYRGKKWKIHQLKEKHRRNRKHADLTYRGIHYSQD